MYRQFKKLENILEERIRNTGDYEGDLFTFGEHTEARYIYNKLCNLMNEVKEEKVMPLEMKKFVEGNIKILEGLLDKGEVFTTDFERGKLVAYTGMLLFLDELMGENYTNELKEMFR